ncbi:MAG: ISAzo13 family transposase [Pseudomonadota bacterium]
MSTVGIDSSWLKLLSSLSESQKRWYAGQKALELGRGGVARVHRATGLSRTTIREGVRELKSRRKLPAWGRVRKEGGGRKSVESQDPALLAALERLLSDSTAGDNMASLRWTLKSTRTLATELKQQGHSAAAATVCRLLRDLDYSLQLNQKSIAGSDHPDRDAQFRYINQVVADHRASGDPVLSVDTKKKELIGNFKNAGGEYRKKGDPRPTKDHDFRSEDTDRAVPYGLYDERRNHGLVNVGLSHDTAEFATESIRQWWRLVGRENYPKARRLLICADSGGSNASRSRVLKVEIQKVADATGLDITFCHYPPGTSKWNKIEHRMFSFISLNWKGKPLETVETVLNLIAGTRTKTGLTIEARLDAGEYKKGVEVTDAMLGEVNLHRHSLHPQWNYTISPKGKEPGVGSW